MADKGKSRGDPSKLRPFNTLPPEKALEIRRKGAQAACRVVRRKKAIADIYAELLQMDVPMEAADLGALTETVQEMAKKRRAGLTAYEAMSLAVLAQSMQGNVQAAAFVRDSAGDKPKDEVKQETTITAGDLELLRKIGADNLAKLKDGEK